MTPSVPVESREQPSGYVSEADDLYRALAERDATISRLRSEVQRFTVLLDAQPEDDDHAWQTNAAQWLWERDRALAERDRARDLAAHLEADAAKLREEPRR